MFLAIGILIGLLAIFAIIGGVATENKPAWIGGCAGIVIAIILVVVHFNTAQGERMLKDINSNTSGGLERVIKVYDQSGNLMETYEGKIDVRENDYGNKVLFDLDGKRTIIYNATVIVQEK